MASAYKKVFEIANDRDLGSEERVSRVIALLVAPHSSGVTIFRRIRAAGPKTTLDLAASPTTIGRQTPWVVRAPVQQRAKSCWKTSRVSPNRKCSIDREWACPTAVYASFATKKALT